MAEVEIVKAQQEQTGAKSFWDNRRFAELMNYSHKDAAQYCIDCGIDTEINGVSVYEIVNGSKPVEEVVEWVEWEEIPTLTKEDLQELLKANEIKFHPATGLEKLMLIAQENKLI